MTILTNGNVGIGNASPQSKLDVQGQIVSKEYSTSGAAVDFANGNTQILSAPGTSVISLSGMVAGGQYTLVITDITSRNYSFPACTTIHAAPALAATNQQSIYSILYTSVGCYISWTTGF